MEREILPKYFKHSNLNSFVRQVPPRFTQLNMYHFVKSKSNGLRNEFENSHFRRDDRYNPKRRRSMLPFVRRKPEQKRKRPQDPPAGKENKKSAEVWFDPSEVRRYMHSIQELVALRTSAIIEHENAEERGSMDNDSSNHSFVCGKDSPGKSVRHVSFQFL